MNFRNVIILALCIIFTAADVAHADGMSVIGGLIREQVVAPGATTRERIVVRNSSQDPLQVSAEIRDYLFYANGQIIYGEPGSVERSNSSWLTMVPSEFVIAPGDSATIDVTQRVPQDESLSGTYWSILMVAPVPAERLAPPNSGDEEPTIGIRSIMRYGIQIVTQVGDSGVSDVRFAEFRLEREGPTSSLQLDIENTGTRSLRPTVWAEAFDSDGISLGRFMGGQKGIMPECSSRFGIDVSELPAGQYTALIVADAGDDDIFGTRYQLDLE